jgi:hypothetical protein
MRKWSGSMALLAMVAGGSSAWSAMNAPDASLTSDTGAQTADAASDGAEGSLDAGTNPDACVRTCPAMEPAVGDPCDSFLDCEYGDDPRFECNRVYACASGHFQTFFRSNDAGCPTTLAAGCPPSRASLTTGAACTAMGLQCTYVEGECDCAPGTYDAGSSWFCLSYNSLVDSDAACPVPRPRLGTACSLQADCTYESNCTFQACSCGRWALDLVPCNMPPPPHPVDGGADGPGDSSIDSGLGDDSSVDGSVGRGDASTGNGVVANSGGCSCLVADRQSGVGAGAGWLFGIALLARCRRSGASKNRRSRAD